MLIMISTTLANTPPQSSAILIAIDTEILLDTNFCVILFPVNKGWALGRSIPKILDIYDTYNIPTIST